MATASTLLPSPSPTAQLARWADRLAMWVALREHYGRNYPIDPVQVTQVSWEPYLELSPSRDRERLFPRAEPPRAVREERVSHLLDHPERRPRWLPKDLGTLDADADLERTDFEFPSPHVPLSPAFARQARATPENHIVSGRMYAPAGVRPTRALLVVHGFAAPNLDSMARFTPARRMAARGAAIAVVSLPYHGRRTPAAARFSGELFLSGDVVRTLEAVLQAVADLRATVAWLRDARGIEKVGLVGASLGGYLATLAAAVEPEVAMLYGIAPPIRVVESLDAVPLGRYVRQGLEAQRVPRDVLERLQDLVDPSSMKPGLSTACMRFIAGRNDLFVPHTQMLRLAAAWEGLTVHWHDWGHVTALRAWPPRRLFDEIESFADSVGI